MPRGTRPPIIPMKDRLAILRASHLTLKDMEEAEHYVLTLHTPDELPRLAHRLLIFFLLYAGYNYNEIKESLGVGNATIRSGSRFRQDHDFVDPLIEKLMMRLRELGFPEIVDQLVHKKKYKK